MDQEWFEMPEVKKRYLDDDVWIPLRRVGRLISEGEYGYIGFREEYFGVGSIAIPIEYKTNAEKLTWTDVGLRSDNSVYMDDNEYIPADLYRDYGKEFTGIHLLLVQRGNSVEHQEWHLHQDIVIGLGLKREDDIWVCPDEGYKEVARLKRDDDGSPRLLEIRSEYLKDYLCGRGMALYITSYRSRQEIVEDPGHIDWKDNPEIDNKGQDRWEGRVNELHEGGHPFGSTTAFIHVARTDVDPEEDVPVVGDPTDDNIDYKSWKKKATGEKIFRVQGELWRNEWVNPGSQSSRIRGDEIPSTVRFIIDSAGTLSTISASEKDGRWLWFTPDVMMVLAHRRGGNLNWYTRHTGQVGCSPDYNVHFGINRAGLINVYMKDIAYLPEWQQKIWAGYNTNPDGKVSRELLSSQMEAKPADTQAPEAFLEKGLVHLNKVFYSRFGSNLYRDHFKKEEILKRTHRFRSLNQDGFFALSKDLDRLTIEPIEKSFLQTIAQPPENKSWGSIKSLENVLATIVTAEEARSVLSPLVGISELRQADAHLPANDLKESLSLVKVIQGEQPIFQGLQLLNSCVSSLYGIIDILAQDGKDDA